MTELEHAIKHIKTRADAWAVKEVTEALRSISERLDKALSQEPKTGHWIAYEVQLPDRVVLNYHCSVCGRKLVGYSTETLKDAPYCHCGARMVEPQESEDKE